MRRVGEAIDVDCHATEDVGLGWRMELVGLKLLAQLVLLRMKSTAHTHAYPQKAIRALNNLLPSPAQLE